MRNFLSLMFAIASLLAMSCEPKASTVEDAKLEITSEPIVEVGADGGMINIAYTLGGGDHSAIEVTTDNADMITAINTDDYGFVRVMVSANPDNFEREAQVFICFDGMAHFVTIRQMAKSGSSHEVINITATQLSGNYYGDRLVSNLGHYWIILTDGGFADGGLANNAEFFRLDLLGPLADESNIRIPDGTYDYEVETSFMPYTILNLGSTDYVYIDDIGESWSVLFTEAQLVVDGETMTLVARTEDKEFHVTFSGDYSIAMNEISTQISTLDGDYEIDLTGCEGVLTNFGDYWECGLYNWQIEFVHSRGMKYGTYLVLDFLTSSLGDGDMGVTGTYTSSGFTEEDPTKPAFAPYTFVPGMQISDDGVFMMGSLLMVYKDGVGIDQAPIFDGEFTITDHGNGTYTLVINALDDATPANKITLTWTGKLG
jgi:hypothetical protein